MTTPSKSDKDEFQDYLNACTDRQCLGVLDKEKSAGRTEYAQLAREECLRRHLL